MDGLLTEFCSLIKAWIGSGVGELWPPESFESTLQQEKTQKADKFQPLQLQQLQGPKPKGSSLDDLYSYPFSCR